MSSRETDEKRLQSLLDDAAEVASRLNEHHESAAAFAMYVRDPILRAQHNAKNYTQEALRRRLKGARSLNEVRTIFGLDHLPNMPKMPVEVREAMITTFVSLKEAWADDPENVVKLDLLIDVVKKGQ